MWQSCLGDWCYRKNAPRDTVLEELENDAREGRKGLWTDPQPIPPWEVAESVAAKGELTSRVETDLALFVDSDYAPHEAAPFVAELVVFWR